MTEPKLAVYALAALTLAACGGSPNAKDKAALAALQTRIAALEHRKELVADTIDIERLQAAFGYYFDKAFWDDVANLFADDGTIEIALDGVYVGKARVREYLNAYGRGQAGAREGRLDEHLQAMPVVTLAPAWPHREGALARNRARRRLRRRRALGRRPIRKRVRETKRRLEDQDAALVSGAVRAVRGWLADEPGSDRRQARYDADAGSATERRVQDVARHVPPAVQLPESGREIRAAGG
jgi:hypothetical protein